MMPSLPFIKIDIQQQLLSLFDNNSLIKSYQICSAKNGLGEQAGSECTPRGEHTIRAKIGRAAALGSVFVGRRLTGEIYQPTLAASQPNRDWILSRILWLSGLEKGRNRLGSVDTMRRYIYIHGAPDELILPQPSSHGCIRMFNEDIIELYERVEVATRVIIE
ncbi:L,D-transpeptidase [Cycloclasticus sp. 46_120_T64]|nr:L,D-transpeptidase [Cycloclasticus sp. 46_120_T64]